VIAALDAASRTTGAAAVTMHPSPPDGHFRSNDFDNATVITARLFCRKRPVVVGQDETASSNSIHACEMAERGVKCSAGQQHETVTSGRLTARDRLIDTG
jgi:hypothetical protein